MTKRLEILKNSLLNKEANFDNRLDNHIATVKQANGQPLNDKRNGRATLNKWEKQNNSLRNLQAGIEKTKEAIDKEEYKIVVCSSFDIPAPIQALLDAGKITQWRKFPNRFFVVGVEKARIIFEDGKLFHKFARDIPTNEQHAIFRDLYNNLKREFVA